MPLIILFMVFVMPFLEIGVFVKVGGILGAGNTVLLTLLTGVFGIVLIRWQGLSAVLKIRGQMNQEVFPFEGIFQGALVLLAGVMLFIPGFITDSIGLLLFVPLIRKAIYNVYSSGSKTIIREEYSSKGIFEEQNIEESKIIDVDYKDISNDDKKNDS